MMQYLITALAGIALGMVGMRLWQTRESAQPVAGPDDSSPNTDARSPASAGSSRKLLYGAGALVAAALAVIALRPGGDGNSGSPALAGAGTAPDAGAKPLDDVDSMIAKLAARLERQPNDGEGWRMLGWSYVATGHADKAIEPYRRALALLPKSAIVHAGYGEALTVAGGNKVSAEAKAEFDKALTLDPAEPRARYFSGLWLAQNGHEREAIDKWIALANSAPPETPWQAEVRQKIAQVAQKLGVDVSGRLKGNAFAGAAPSAVTPGPDPSQVQAAAQLPEGQRKAMVDGMVEGLAAKLAANPRNPDGWAMLLRSRMVMKQEQQAKEDLAIARKSLAGDAAGLAKVNQVAAQLGVPGAK